jgi:hypothetical protein
MEWFTVVERLVKLQETVNLCIVKDLTALGQRSPTQLLIIHNCILTWLGSLRVDITNRIMRRENYLIALINMNRLDFSIPFVKQCRPSSDEASSSSATATQSNGSHPSHPFFIASSLLIHTYKYHTNRMHVMCISNK